MNHLLVFLYFSLISWFFDFLLDSAFWCFSKKSLFYSSTAIAWFQKETTWFHEVGNMKKPWLNYSNHSADFLINLYFPFIPSAGYFCHILLGLSSLWLSSASKVSSPMFHLVLRLLLHLLPRHHTHLSSVLCAAWSLLFSHDVCRSHRHWTALISLFSFPSPPSICLFPIFFFVSSLQGRCSFRWPRCTGRSKSSLRRWWACGDAGGGVAKTSRPWAMSWQPNRLWASWFGFSIHIKIFDTQKQNAVEELLAYFHVCLPIFWDGSYTIKDLELFEMLSPKDRSLISRPLVAKKMGSQQRDVQFCGLFLCKIIFNGILYIIHSHPFGIDYNL